MISDIDIKGLEQETDLSDFAHLASSVLGESNYLAFIRQGNKGRQDVIREARRLQLLKKNGKVLEPVLIGKDASGQN